MFDLAELERAHEIVGQAVPPTPAHAWPLLAERLGTQVVVKHENHTPIGAFKVRGGLVYLDRLKRERPQQCPASFRRRAAITARALRSPRRRYGVPAAIYVPRGNSVEKNRAMQRLRRRAGRARRGLSGRARRAQRSRAVRQACTWCRRSIPTSCWASRPMRSNCSRAAPDLDVLYVPIGQGSGICGCIMARDLLGLKTEIVGVQSTEAPSYALSFAAGTVVTTETSNTLADGMATRIPDAGRARDHPQGRLAHRAGHGRRGRRSDPRLLDRHAQSRRRRRRSRRWPRRLQEKTKLAGKPRRPDPVRRQYRFRSVPADGVGTEAHAPRAGVRTGAG